MCISFPRYDSLRQLAGRYLNGDFGPLESVDPTFLLLYAGDRFEAKGK